MKDTISTSSTENNVEDTEYLLNELGFEIDADTNMLRIVNRKKPWYRRVLGLVKGK